jgi:hypothetical protein
MRFVALVRAIATGTVMCTVTLCATDPPLRAGVAPDDPPEPPVHPVERMHDASATPKTREVDSMPSLAS